MARPLCLVLGPDHLTMPSHNAFVHLSGTLVRLARGGNARCRIFDLGVGNQRAAGPRRRERPRRVRGGHVSSNKDRRS
jgi:hypothetical protein